MRLIDADALIKDITNSADLGGELGKVVEVVKAYAKFMVATAPTIQIAQPERESAEWVKNDNGTYSCSKCQSWIPKEQIHYARYCLYCGSKMERRTDEAD